MRFQRLVRAGRGVCEDKRGTRKNWSSNWQVFTGSRGESLAVIKSATLSVRVNFFCQLVLDLISTDLKTKSRNYPNATTKLKFDEQYFLRICLG